MSLRDNVLAEIAAERARQELKWGEQNHPDRFYQWRQNTPRDFYERLKYGTDAHYWKSENARRVGKRNAEGSASDRNAAWDGILLEEVYEALAEEDPEALRTELIQVAAVAAAWVEAIDRRVSPSPSQGGGTDG